MDDAERNAELASLRKRVDEANASAHRLEKLAKAKSFDDLDWDLRKDVFSVGKQALIAAEKQQLESLLRPLPALPDEGVEEVTAGLTPVDESTVSNCGHE